MHAEQAYVFRHAVLRDAAYQLQLPSERARIHGLVIEIIEGIFGGRPSEADLDGTSEAEFEPHPLDAFAHELAWHAQCALEAFREAGAPARESKRRLCRLYLRRAAERSEAIYQYSSARSAWRQLSVQCEGVQRCECLRREAAAAVRSTRYGEAEDIANQALSLAREERDPRSEGRALAVLSAVYYSTRRARLCEQAGRDALEVTRKVHDPRTEAAVLSILGNHYVANEDYPQGEDLNRQALAIYRTLGHRRGEVAVQANLGNLQFLAGHFPEAEEHDRIALRLSKRHGYRDLEAHTLVNLAEVLGRTGRPEKVEPTLSRASAIARESGLQFYQGYILGELANHLMKQGHPDRAELSFREAIDALRDLEEPARTGNMFCMRALCLVALGKRFEAAPLWKEGSALLRRESAEQLLGLRNGEMLKACAKAGVVPLE